jgi:alanine racemase
MNRAAAVVDLGAIGANLRRVRESVQHGQVMAVVKADAYGHGVSAVARAARLNGASWLGVALPSEALALRALGDEGPVLAWLWTPGDPALAACVRAGVSLSVSSVWAVDDVAAAARQVGRAAHVHVKADTGLSRNGATREQLPAVLAAVAAARDEGLLDVQGIWSHLADGDVPGAPSVSLQHGCFERALASAASFGIEPPLRHLANSGAALAHPDTHYDLVRVGIAMYGLTPNPALGTSAELGLRPAMSLVARLAHVKGIEAGAGVSYGGTWMAERETAVGLVPLGYADGVPRAASSRAEVAIAGVRRPIVGRVAMDQFVVDLGSSNLPQVGDEVRLFGPGDLGEPTADDWAERLGTIGYEIVTRIGPRVPREYVGVGS